MEQDEFLTFFLNAEPYQVICMSAIIIVFILAFFTDFFNNLFRGNR